MGSISKRSKAKASEAPPSDSGSDEELYEHQHGSRKRRKVSPVSKQEVESRATSRIKAKKTKAISELETHMNSHDSMPVVVDEEKSFASLNVAPWLVASLANMAIKYPTGIQKECSMIHPSL